MTWRRTICGVVLLLVTALALYALWRWLLEGTVLIIAVRHLTRDRRRRRPKSSWSSLGRTGALMFAAWNSRWLAKGANGKPLRVTVPAAADGEPADPVPF